MKLRFGLPWHAMAIIYVVISIVLAGSVFFLQKELNRQVAVFERERSLEKLASDLAAQSDLLSEAARAYVESREERHLVSFWKTVDVDLAREKILANILALDVSPADFRIIGLAKAYSDDLLLTDTRAMKLAALAKKPSPEKLLPQLARFNLSSHESLLSPTQKLQLARQMLYDEAYKAQKAKIARAVDKFHNRVIRDSQARILAAQRQLGATTVMLVIVSLCVPLVLIYDFSRRRLGEQRVKAFISLGERLSAVSTPEQAAWLIAETSDRLMGWDACIVELYDAQSDLLTDILSIDTVDGRRTVVTNPVKVAPKANARRVLTEGPFLILRRRDELRDKPTQGFGELERPSASLMYVPVRKDKQVIGLLSVQSYSQNAYDTRAMADLQWLADRCAAALERAHLHEALRLSEERYRVLLENNLDGVYLIQDEKILYCNAAYARTFGYGDPHEIIEQKTVRDLIVLEEREEMHGKLLRRTAGEAEGERFIFTGIRSDASRFRCEALGTRIRYKGRDAVLGTLRDVSDRERAEREIRLVHEYYRRAIEALEAAPYLIEFGSRKYDFLGDSIVHLTGFEAEELDTETFASRVHKYEVLGEQSEVPPQQLMERMLAGEIDHLRADILFERKDGSFVWMVDASIPRTDSSGRVVGSLGILMDITERKRNEVRVKVFASLGESLNTVTSAQAAARVIVETGSVLFAWDACAVNLYESQADLLTSVLQQDTIDEARQDCDLVYLNSPPSALARRVLFEGPQLILRAEGGKELPDASPFGDRTRRSASLMFAPMRKAGQPIGYLSFQSYKPKAYSQRDLEDLQALADHCASGLERAHLYELLHQSEEQFRSVWEHAGSGMRLTDSQGIIRMVNPAFCELVEMPKEQLVGLPFCVYYMKEIGASVMSRYQTRFANRTIPPSFERTMRLWNSSELVLNVTNTFVTTTEGPMLLCVFRDRTAEKALENELRHYASQLERLATVDGLTGLLNHRAFIEKLKGEMARAQRYGSPLSVLMMDLDHFKQVNDSYGHLIGDTVLARTGEVILDSIRETDFAGRYGGEEFCIAMPMTDVDGAHAFAERLRSRLHELIFRNADEVVFRVTCSIGVAQFPGVGTDVTELLTRADRALYDAKQNGRNRVCV